MPNADNRPEASDASAEFKASTTDDERLWPSIRFPKALKISVKNSRPRVAVVSLSAVLGAVVAILLLLAVLWAVVVMVVPGAVVVIVVSRPVAAIVEPGAVVIIVEPGAVVIIVVPRPIVVTVVPGAVTVILLAIPVLTDDCVSPGIETDGKVVGREIVGSVGRLVGRLIDVGSKLKGSSGSIALATAIKFEPESVVAAVAGSN